MVDPHHVLEAIDSLLDDNGGIKSPNYVPRIVGFMSDNADKLPIKLVYILILRSTSSQACLKKFMDSDGWKILSDWLNTAVISLTSSDSTVYCPKFIEDLLQLYAHLPVTIPLLKATPAPKVIKQLSKTDDSNLKSVKSLAKSLVSRWMKVINGETNAGAPSPPHTPTSTSAALTTSFKVNPKRKTSSSTLHDSKSSQSKKSKSDNVTAPTAAPVNNKRNSSTESKPVTAPAKKVVLTESSSFMDAFGPLDPVPVRPKAMPIPTKQPASSSSSTTSTTKKSSTNNEATSPTTVSNSHTQPSASSPSSNSPASRSPLPVEELELLNASLGPVKKPATRRIRWAPEPTLRQVCYYELFEEERVMKSNRPADFKKAEMIMERSAILQAREWTQSGGLDLETSSGGNHASSPSSSSTTIQWHLTPIDIPETCVFPKPEGFSANLDFSESLETIYFSAKHIPASPHEPSISSSSLVETAFGAETKMIPLDVPCEAKESEPVATDSANTASQGPIAIPCDSEGQNATVISPASASEQISKVLPKVSLNSTQVLNLLSTIKLLKTSTQQPQPATISTYSSATATSQPTQYVTSGGSNGAIGVVGAEVRPVYSGRPPSRFDQPPAGYPVNYRPPPPNQQPPPPNQFNSINFQHPPPSSFYSQQPPPPRFRQHFNGPPNPRPCRFFLNDGFCRKGYHCGFLHPNGGHPPSNPRGVHGNNQVIVPSQPVVQTPVATGSPPPPAEF